VKLNTVDVAPPGFTTVIDTVPLVEIRLAGTVAVTLSAFTTVVASAVLPHITFAPERK
jgi:hypothetical protein